MEDFHENFCITQTKNDGIHKVDFKVAQIKLRVRKKIILFFESFGGAKSLSVVTKVVGQNKSETLSGMQSGLFSNVVVPP